MIAQLIKFAVGGGMGTFCHYFPYLYLKWRRHRDSLCSVFLSAGYGCILRRNMQILGGIQLLSIGIAGEYIGRIFMETKNRPLYIIKEIYEGPAAFFAPVNHRIHRNIK